MGNLAPLPVIELHYKYKDGKKQPLWKWETETVDPHGGVIKIPSDHHVKFIVHVTDDKGQPKKGNHYLKVKNGNYKKVTTSDEFRKGNQTKYTLEIHRANNCWARCSFQLELVNDDMKAILAARQRLQ